MSWFHLHKLTRAARNEKQARINKWKFLAHSGPDFYMKIQFTVTEIVSVKNHLTNIFNFERKQSKYRILVTGKTFCDLGHLNFYLYVCAWNLNFWLCKTIESSEFCDKTLIMSFHNLKKELTQAKRGLVVIFEIVGRDISVIEYYKSFHWFCAYTLENKCYVFC